jgi:hypothetical protein
VPARCHRDPIERRTEFSKQGTTFRRQYHAPIHPAEQHRRPEPLFKQVNLPANRAVRHTEFGRSVLEAAAASRGFEGTDCIQWWKKSALQWGARHDVSFSDLKPENNSIVSVRPSIQIIRMIFFRIGLVASSSNAKRRTRG